MDGAFGAFHKLRKNVIFRVVFPLNIESIASALKKYIMTYHHSSVGKRPGNSTYEFFKVFLLSKVECKLDFLDKTAFLKHQSSKLNA